MAIITAKSIDRDVLWSRMAIRPPYFALDDLRLESDGTVSAKIPVQHPIGWENGQIAAAEVGRHLAILGSCAVALSQPDSKKHYYLAQHAHLRQQRQGQPQPNDPRGILWGVAKPEPIDRRTATASTQLFMDRDKVLYDLTVEYALVPERVFERLFARYRNTTVKTDVRYNPYLLAIPLKDVNTSHHRLTASLCVDSPARCVGHFPEFPAIPVAILMQVLCEASAILMQQILGWEPVVFTVTEAQVRARNLAFADETIAIEVDHLYGRGDLHVLRCVARTGSDREVGHMELTIRV